MTVLIDSKQNHLNVALTQAMSIDVTFLHTVVTVTSETLFTPAMMLFESQVRRFPDLCTFIAITFHRAALTCALGIHSV